MEYLHPTQRRLHLARRLKPIDSSGGDRLKQKLCDVFAEVEITAKLACIDGLSRLWVVAGERMAVRDELVKHNAEREEVHVGAPRVAPIRRPVSWRTRATLCFDKLTRDVEID